MVSTAILITGRLLNKSIPISADTTLVSVMTRIFIINTIAARGKVGIKDSMASVLGSGPAVIRPGASPASRPGTTGSRTVTSGVSPPVPAVRPGSPPVPACLRDHGLHRSLLAVRRQPTGPAVRPASAHRLPAVVVRVSPPVPTVASGSAHRLRPAVRRQPTGPAVRPAHAHRNWSRAPGASLPPWRAVNLKNLLGVKKNRRVVLLPVHVSQIAPPGRSGIILHILY